MRNKQYIIVEMKRILPIQFHVIETGRDQLSAANQARSLEAFRHRGYKELAREKMLDHWFRFTEFNEASQEYHGLPTDLKNYIGNLPTIQYADVWEFYKSIGYDYKRQKFL